MKVFKREKYGVEKMQKALISWDGWVNHRIPNLNERVHYV